MSGSEGSLELGSEELNGLNMGEIHRYLLSRREEFGEEVIQLLADLRSNELDDDLKQRVKALDIETLFFIYQRLLKGDTPIQHKGVIEFIASLLRNEKRNELDTLLVKVKVS